MPHLLAASTRPRCFSALAFLGFASVLFLPRPADACSPPPDPIATFGASDVPVDGVLVFRLSRLDSTDDLLVKQGEADVSGTFAVLDESARLYTWTPTAELTVGAEYTLRTADEPSANYPLSVPFTAVAASAEAPQLSSRFTRLERGDEPFGCTSPSSSTLGSCVSTSFFDATAYHPFLELLITGAARSQFLYDVTWTADGEPVNATGLFSNELAREFTNARGSICYSLVARPLAGGDEIDLGDGCLETDELDLETTDADFGNRDQFFKNCLVPPTSSAGAKLTREWCDTFRSEIDAGDCTGAPMDSCEAALEVCSDEGSGGSTGDDDDDENTGNEGPADEGGGGCSVSHANRVSSAPAALTLAVAAAMMALRRRRALARVAASPRSGSTSTT